MGFFTERRPSYPVRVLITDSPAHDPEFDLPAFRVGETYEVAPRVAEYLIGSNHAVVDRRHAPRNDERSPHYGRPTSLP
jgi:hypothetical protein